MDGLLSVERLTKRFPLDGKASIVAANDVSFSIARGETLGLVGESGSGKTTVGRCVLRLTEPTSGRIVFDGHDITTLGDSALRSLRPRMQLVFQDPFGSLNPRYSVRETLEEPLTLQGVLGGSERKSRVSQILSSTGLSSDHLKQYPAHLTASEQQRVGIARAIVTHPDLVVLDEPTSNLDPSVRAEILDLLVSLQAEYGTSYLFISHDLTAVESVSHRIAIMYLGRLVEVGPMRAIQTKQLHPYSRALLSAVLYPDPNRPLPSFTLTGEIPSAIDPPDECPLVARCPFVLDRCSAACPPLVAVEEDHLSACYRSREFLPGGVPAESGGSKHDAEEEVRPEKNIHIIHQADAL
jgi:oligopeptide/dipeptide ABC transporter ATP-binding protein